MDSLIDINVGSGGSVDAGRGDVSAFKYRELTPEFVQKQVLTGLFLGFLVALGIGLIPWLISLAIESGESESFANARSVTAALVLLVGASIGAAYFWMKTQEEGRDGFLKISDNDIEFWTKSGNQRMLLADVFGAGPIKGTLYTYLRFYHLSPDERGFAFKQKNFRNYEPVSGLALNIGLEEDDTNSVVRKAVIRHINNRHRDSLPVAGMPPYKYNAVQIRRQFVVFGDTVTDAVFECDGKTIRYLKGEELFEIPVRSVLDVKVVEVRSKHGRTAYYVNLELDLSTGFDKLKIDILHMPKPEEIDKYMRAIPTLFPEPKDGYWV